MKILLATFAALVSIAVIGVAAGSASAPTVVGLNGCFYSNGGSDTVPGGATVVVRAGFAAKTRGLMEDFLHDVTTTASLNGVPIANPDLLWTSPSPDTTDPYWSSWQFYPVGILSAGQSVTLTLNWTLSHPYWDGVTLNPDGSHGASGPGVNVWTGTTAPATCTITGD